MNTAQKTCFKCKAVKPITDFYVHPAMGDRRLGKCKECTKKDVSANYRANIQAYKEYERSRAQLPHRVAARNEYAQTHEGREACRRARLAYVVRNPLKQAAHVLCGNAIRDGRLTRQPCEVCGNGKSHAHHDDYGKPLEVRWLCATHHSEWHKQNVPICPEQSEKAA